MKAKILVNYIITLTNEWERPISNLQLGKILYLVNLFYLSEKGRVLITDEQFKAHKIGPVIQSVYDEYFICGSNPIFTTSKNTSDTESRYRLDLMLNKGVHNLILNLAELSMWDLLEHVDKTAYKRVIAANPDVFAPIIPVDEILKDVEILFGKEITPEERLKIEFPTCNKELVSKLHNALVNSDLDPNDMSNITQDDIAAAVMLYNCKKSVSDFCESNKENKTLRT